jgi:hypothetical protein
MQMLLFFSFYLLFIFLFLLLQNTQKLGFVLLLKMLATDLPAGRQVHGLVCVVCDTIFYLFFVATEYTETQFNFATQNVSHRFTVWFVYFVRLFFIYFSLPQKHNSILLRKMLATNSRFGLCSL